MTVYSTAVSNVGVWREDRLGYVLAFVNGIGCLLFVLLRDPISATYLADLDKVHRAGGMSLNSAVMGTIACRTLYSWSEWHGGEALGVKILEIVNVPAFVIAQLVDVVGRITVASKFSFCAWTWVVAFYFLAAATIQWIAFGTLWEFVIGRARGR